MKNVLARGGIEFIAVFLGIALSLWVDEYRENNEIQRLNDSILNRLYDNLESDSTNFTWVINAHKTSLKSCNSINKWIDSNQNIHDSVNIHISRVAINTFTWANKEEYSSLKMSGRLDLIKNEELVKTLHEYYSQIEFAQKVEDDLNSDWIQNEFIPFIADYSNYFGNPIKEDIYGYYYPQFVLHSVPQTNKIKYFVSRKIKTSNGAIFVYDGLLTLTKKLRKLIRGTIKIT
ncbi:MAG: hypothetical protein ACJZ10_05635 [Candidatus Neomarinimicrobiota bacterium]